MEAMGDQDYVVVVDGGGFDLLEPWFNRRAVFGREARERDAALRAARAAREDSHNGGPR